jgi:hypothetical protein
VIYSFKDFLIKSREGEFRALYILPKMNMIKENMVRLFDEANANTQGDVIINLTNGNVRVGESMAYFRNAHPYLEYALAGQLFHAIYGLEHLDKFDNAVDQQQKLMSRVRR